MPLFLGVMTKDTKGQSTNHPISKFLVRVVGTLMVMVVGREVETTFHTKILDTLKQDSSTNSTAPNSYRGSFI